MGKYVAKRFALMLMSLTIITFMCFVLVRMLPPAELPIGDPHTAVIEARREAAGYNKPYLVQFYIYVRDIITKWDLVVKILITSCPKYRTSLTPQSHLVIISLT